MLLYLQPHDGEFMGKYLIMQYHIFRWIFQNDAQRYGLVITPHIKFYVLYYVMILGYSWGNCTVYRAFVRFRERNARFGNFGCYLPCVTPPLIFYELISKYKQQINKKCFMKIKRNILIFLIPNVNKGLSINMQTCLWNKRKKKTT